MKSPLAVLSLFLSLASTQGHATTVSRLEAKPDRCPVLEPLMADLNAVPFPADWTVYVACDAGTWRRVEQRAGGLNTETALTDREHKFTVVNGMMYNPFFSFAGYAQKTPERILKHELGHITCNTSSEEVANRYANTGTCYKQASKKR